jgi:hypothetical protein
LKWGAVSDVVETQFGFHILRKSPPPPNFQVAGQHIVLRYIGAVQTEPAGKIIRTRKEALVLARQLATDTHPFAELVRSHSEAADRVRDGDMGVYSTRAPAYNGTEVATLARLQIDEVSDPVDTDQGFQLIKRVDVAPRVTYAATAIRFPYDPSDAAGRERLWRETSGYAARVKADPSAFEALQTAHCCRDVVRWTQGTGDSQLETALEKLTIGAIAETPVDIGWCLLIPKRLDPDSQSVPELLYDLPAPATANANAFIEHSSGTLIAAEVRKLRSAAQVNFPLPEQQWAKLDRALGDFEVALTKASSAGDNLKANQQVLRDVEAALGPADAKRFQSFSDAWLVAEIMQQKRPL